MSEWIKCSERLPAIDQTVLVKQKYTAELMIARIARWGEWVEQCESLQVYGDATWDTQICKNTEADSYDSVTHWMPLPQPPEDV